MTSRVSGSLDLVAMIWQSRRLFFRSVINELRSMYAGTLLGLVWIVFGPVLMLIIYTVIYAVIFQVRVPNFTIQEYILNVFSGLVPFLAFAQGLSAGTGSLKSGRSLFFNMNYPTELIAPKYVFVAYVMLPVGMLMTLAGDAIVSELSWWWLGVPVIMLLQLMFSVGVAYYLSLISLVIRDIQFMIQYLMMALLVITPIAYTPDMISGKLATLLYVNPLFYYVYSYQHLILLNSPPPMDVLVTALVISVVTFVTGFLFFQRARGALSDLL